MRRFTVSLLLAATLLVGLAVAPGVAFAGHEEGHSPTATPTPDGAQTTAQTPTPTETETDTSSSGDNYESRAREARLHVSQPSYVDTSVKESRQNGTMIYEASGEELIITLENVNASAVTNYGVEETDAQLVQREGAYVLTPDADGTYTVWWTTRDGATYEAFVQVTTANYVHLSADEHDAMSSKAGAWEDFVGELRHAGITHGDESIEELQSIADDAVAWYQFYLSPFSAMTGGFIAIVTILISEPGGWLFLALLLALFGVSTYTIVRRNRTLERQFRDIEDLDEADRKAWEQEIKTSAAKSTLQDWGLTDADSEAVKQHTGARNPRQFASWIAGNIGEIRIIRKILAAYEQLGHEIEVTRDAEDNIMSVELLEPDANPAAEVNDDAVATDGGEVTTETVKPSQASDAVIKRLDWTPLEGDIFWHPEVDTSEIEMPVQNDRNSDGFDLIDDADIPIGEDGSDHYILKRREEFVDVLLEIVEEAAASTYTDEDGRPRPEVDFIEMIYGFVSHGAEKYRLSFWDLRDVLLATRAQLDDDERLDQLATKSEDNEL